MNTRAIFVASNGGHLAELVQLRATLVGQHTDVTWVTFDCAQSRSLLVDEPNVIYVPEVGTRGYRALLGAVVPALRVLRQVRPHRVYSTGAAIALAFLPLAILVGARATYIESATRVEGPSMTGRLLGLFPWIRLRTQYRSWANRRWRYGTSVFEELTAHEISSKQRPVRRVVVTLGTQPKYPFVRLVRRLREILPHDVEVLWQIGPDFPESVRPEGAYEFVTKSTMREWLGSADAVIAHAGVGSALSALAAGHKPVLVARRGAHGEHVDDHQVQLAGELAERNLAVVTSPAELTWEHIVEASRSVVVAADHEAQTAELARTGIDVPVEAAATEAPAVEAPAAEAPATETPADLAEGRAGLRRRALVSVAAIIALVGSGAVVDSADAVGHGTAQSTMPTAVPSTATPNVTNGVVYAIDQVGSQIVLGGSFTGVQNQRSSTTLTRPDVLAFDASSGAVSTTFAPTLDGTVEAVAPGPSANTVYVGGFFNTVNGTRSKGIALLNTQTGALVPGFTPPALNGAVYTIAYTNGELLIGGSFTVAGASARNGLASLNPTTGALDNYLSVALTGHHNYNGSGANGAVGPRAMAVNPAGTRLFVLGNFKNANGTLHDQAAMIDLSTSSATLDANWNTGRFNAACASGAFDTYVTDVQWSPDGSYFVVVATGGGGITYNADGTRSLCDSASRWETANTGTNVQPSWVDYTGNDTFWTVALTGTAVYVGGHQRWVNNDYGSDYPNSGAIPRPGLAALDPVSGMPLTWNPGRNPRGAGAYAIYVNANGVYVGSDTDYIGDFNYVRRKIAYFPLAGGYTPAATTTAALPSNVYLAGASTPDTGYGADDLYSRSYDGASSVGPDTRATSGVSWGSTRGAFAVGNQLFWGQTDGNFYRASFNGTTVGTPSLADPYDDPKWDSVATGSGQTYQGVKPSFYSNIPNLTGAFYSAGRLFYTVAGSSALYWRWFSPDSGAVGATPTSSTTVDFSHVAGMFVSGSSIYWASSTDGTLHRVTLSGTSAVAGTDTVVSGPAQDGHNWAAHGLFTYGSTAPITSKVAYVGSSGGYAVSASPSTTVPSATQAGNTELLFVTAGTNGVTTTTPSGFTQVGRETNAPLETTVYARTSDGTDAGTSVAVPLTASTRADLRMVVYSGAVTPTSSSVAVSGDTNVANHVTPSIANPAGAWLVSYWGVRTSTTSTWSSPTGVTIRSTGANPGGGHVDALVGDSGPLAAGTSGAISASSGAVSGKGGMVSVVLASST